MRYIGLDLGAKTLGVSLSDNTGLIASFYKNIRYENEDELILEIDKIIKENNVNEIVLGYPKNMNNTVGERALITENFKNKLENLGYTVHLEDERLTTKVAESVLVDADLSRKKRKKYIDGVSAVLILQSFLDRKDNTNG